MAESTVQAEPKEGAAQSIQMPSGIVGEGYKGNVVGENALQLSDFKANECIPGVAVALKGTENELMSLASIETQPPPNYTQFGPVYPQTEFAYDPEKQYPAFGPYYPGCFALDASWSYNCGQIMDGVGIMHKQLSMDSRSSMYNSGRGFMKYEHEAVPVPLNQEYAELQKKEAQAQQQSAIDGANGKIIPANPIILVDKVERSLIVQWFENGIRREQRISYKKYGNAKAQQRAENLISKLHAGSTFDQLYPEKGPPILSIYENVGEYKVSLTRDRILREWRVDWVDTEKGKMRARWSCKKVGNEEAKKRAEAFADSLMQGTFNPRLLHKATGTRLSRNDMKYNGVINDTDYAKQNLAVTEENDLKHEYEAAARKKRGFNNDPLRRRNVRGGGRWKASNRESLRNPQTGKVEYRGGPLDATYPTYYPIYTDERDKKDSAMSRQYANLTTHGETLLSSSWPSWDATQKLDYSGNSEWDYSAYAQPFDFLPQGPVSQVEWVNSQCAPKYLNSAVDMPMSMQELVDEASADGQNANPGLYYSCYPYFQVGQSVCYPESMSMHDSLNFSNTCFEGELTMGDFKKYNGQVVCAPVQWPDTSATLADSGSAYHASSTPTSCDASGAFGHGASLNVDSKSESRAMDSTNLPSYDFDAEGSEGAVMSSGSIAAV
ncbi:SPE2-interacting protein, putative [Babesia caballi]|uniref:SPE2-interacting protein, putative n=1 Tax=Babesia caballi TaxID=5871 RepID=A0AAV4LZ99_BABCB|nr:SPE2-interacting protein, putative [Babesia caballi]